ncbi:putative ORFan [Tupanvirus deep ocean]|uniref:ORFan n=2 Tax=Tupanvirus TaxID=2094720 RepID=A0AC62A9N5_9VIRU|nr:putative ORFan [Tupanvirus deep ocean]QKU34492.1 putative ORFan [Tupanvirus deep ocean]
MNGNIRIFASPKNIQITTNMNDIIRAIIERDRIRGITINEMKASETIIRAIEDINVALKEISEVKNIISESETFKDRDFTGKLLIKNDVRVERVNGRIISVDGTVFSCGNKLRSFSETTIRDREATTTIDSETGRVRRVMSGITNRDRTEKFITKKIIIKNSISRATCDPKLVIKDDDTPRIN